MISVCIQGLAVTLFLSLSFTWGTAEQNCDVKTDSWWARHVSVEEAAHKLIDSMDAQSIETNLK